MKELIVKESVYEVFKHCHKKKLNIIIFQNCIDVDGFVIPENLKDEFHALFYENKYLKFSTSLFIRETYFDDGYSYERYNHVDLNSISKINQQVMIMESI